ncbi:DUF2334 domain-containing protein [Calditrichota bacterium LG25]
MLKTHLIVLWLILLFAATCSFAQDTLLFVIRVDDILSRNISLQPRSILPFQQTAEAVGAKVTWSVIPHRLQEAENNDGQLRAELAATVQQGHEVAQHGYMHICTLCGQYHEFYCATYQQAFTYEQQSAWISTGRQILQDSVGISPLSFVPPSHVADRTTYNALVDQGFNLISTSGYSLNELREGLFNIPPGRDYAWELTSELYDARKDEALTEIKRVLSEQGIYTLLFHDPFIRRGYENGLVLQWTAELLDSLLSLYGPRLKFVTLSQARDMLLNNSTHLAHRQKLILKSFELSQNFPNPFNGQTRIHYHLGQAARNVSVRFFDANGRLIEAINLGQHLAGNYWLQWNPVNLASGFYGYIFEVRFNDGRVARKSKFCTILK